MLVPSALSGRPARPSNNGGLGPSMSASSRPTAAPAAARASARVYGPRAMRVLETKADIAKARGDKARERAALEDALARSAKAVLTPGQKRVRDGLAKRLSALP
jgi:hypothetical protein